MRVIKFIATIIIITFLPLMVTSALSNEKNYIGSKESNKYHYENCRWVKKIKPEHIVKFKTGEEARNAGYEPCGTCKPRKESLKQKQK